MRVPMGLTLVTPPASEPLTLAEVAAHLRLDSTNVEPRPGAPTAVLAGAGAGVVDVGAHRYRVTFVTADGETDGGDVSAAVTVASLATNGQVQVSTIPRGGPRVTARKLYRTAAGGSTYLLLATIADNTTTTYRDNIADASLGAGVPGTNTTGDPYLASLITTARQYVERALRRALITQTWKATLEAWPSDPFVMLPMPPLIDVTSIQYRDTLQVLQTLDPTKYEVDTASLPGRVHRAYGQSWPAVLPVWNAAQITFRCGYGDTSAQVPDAIKAAMKLIIADLYEQRETQVLGVSVSELPAVQRLLALYRYEEAR